MPKTSLAEPEVYVFERHRLGHWSTFQQSPASIHFKGRRKVQRGTENHYQGMCRDHMIGISYACTDEPCLSKNDIMKEARDCPVLESDATRD